MNQLLFEGVRCFHDLHICPIKPITLLVGENSTGKTTFLALTRIAWDIISSDLSKDLFNEEPFLLGSYDQIASYRGGRAGRNRSFTVGMQFDINLDSDQTGLFANNVKITSRFVQQGSESKLEELLFECGKFNLTGKRFVEKAFSSITITTPKGIEINDHPKQIDLKRSNIYTLLLNFVILESQRTVTSDSEHGDLTGILIQILQSLGQRPYAFAPIRTKPKRTYDPLKTVYDPEGSHVPMLLNRILSDESEDGNKLRKALSFFGETSGLFNKIEVKHKGDKNSDPFQIGVKTTGPSFNLIDVGYGVSQALPIIVDIILNPDGSTFLLQQPEVHLHPRAQAGLGSFLASTAKEQNKKFVIETHSDYLIDRIRMDVRDKKYLNPDDIAILYFEKSQGNVKIHELKLDEYGNIIDAPSTYRQFFLEEERRILGI
jgi:predicted ATPase